VCFFFPNTFLKETKEQRFAAVTIFQKQPLLPSFFNQTIGEGAEEWCLHLQEHYCLHSPVLCGSFSFPYLQQKKILSLLGQLDSACTEEKKKVSTSSYFKGQQFFIPQVLCSFFAAKYSLRKRAKNSE